MEKLIDIDELLKHSHDITLLNGAKHRCIDATVIHEIPTVDAEPVRHGTWKKTFSRWDPYECSECGETTAETIMGEPRYVYCPMCGARMDKE